MRSPKLLQFLALIAAVGVAGCRTSEPEAKATETSSASVKASSGPVTIPSAPPIRNPSLPPLSGRDERGIARIAAPVAALEQNLTGGPLWDCAALFDNSQIGKAIDNAVASRDNSKVLEFGPRALKCAEDLQGFNASLSSFSDAAGVNMYPIEYVISGNDFRYQIASRERTIAAVLSETPGINKKHVEWLYDAAAALDAR